MAVVGKIEVAPPSGNSIQRFQGGLAVNGKLYAAGTIGYTTPTPHMTYDMIMDGATGDVLSFVNERVNGQPSFFGATAAVGANDHIYSATTAGTIIKWNTSTDTSSSISTPTTTTWGVPVVADTRIVWLSASKAMILDTADDSVSEASLYATYSTPFFAPNGYVYAFSSSGSSVLKLNTAVPSAEQLTPRNSLTPTNRGVFITSAGIAYAVSYDGLVRKFDTNTDSSVAGFDMSSVSADIFGNGCIEDDHIYMVKWDAPYGDVLHIDTSDDSYELIGPGDSSQATDVVGDGAGNVYVFRDNNPDIMQIDTTDQSFSILPTAATAGISGQGMSWTGVKVDDKIYFAGRETFFVVSLNGSYVAPVACFTRSPASGEAPLTVSLDASTSYDGTGSIVTYEWDTNEPSGDYEISSSGPTAIFVCSDPGEYSIALHVIDENDYDDYVTLPLSVTDTDATWLQGAYWAYPTTIPSGATGIRKVVLEGVTVDGESAVPVMIGFSTLMDTTLGYASITGAGASSWIDGSPSPRAVMISAPADAVDIELVPSSALTGDEFLAITCIGAEGQLQPDSVSVTSITWVWY